MIPKDFVAVNRPPESCIAFLFVKAGMQQHKSMSIVNFIVHVSCENK